MVWGSLRCAPVADEALSDGDAQDRAVRAVIELLERGNRDFADAVVIRGAPVPAGEPSRRTATRRASPQRPVAAVLGCSDARAPVGQIFGRGNNELFVVRVAGQVLGDEIVASLCFAAAELESLRLMVVLGHRRCAAVSAAVQAHLDIDRAAADRGLLAPVTDRIQPAVRIAHEALVEVRGEPVNHSPHVGVALMEMSVTLNAAMVAGQIKERIATIAPDLRAVCAVYDIDTHLVVRPSTMGEAEPRPGVEDAPDAEGLIALARRLAAGPSIESLLADS